MALEDPEVVQTQNRKRLFYLKLVTFSFGINITAPSLLKDSLRVITVLLLIGNAVSCYGESYFILHFRHSIVIIAECLCLLLQLLISDFKLVYISFVQRRFYKILHLVETHELVTRIGYLSRETPYNKDLRNESRRILQGCWRNAMRQFSFYMLSCCSIVTYYILNAQVVNFYHWYNDTENYTYILTSPTYFPAWQEKINQPAYYVPLSLALASSVFIAGAGAVSFDGMFIFIAMHGAALVRILKKMITHTTSRDVPKNLRMHVLRECIDHYERTYRFCSEFNELYFHITIVQFLLSLVILGVVMFEASLGLEGDKLTLVRMIMYMCAAGYEVVIYCFNGQILFNEFESLPFVWYECEWYNESREFRRLIQMMLMRTNKGFMMRASYFSTLSLETFMALVKTSGSYFLLMQKFKD